MSELVNLCNYVETLAKEAVRPEEKREYEWLTKVYTRELEVYLNS